MGSSGRPEGENTSRLPDGLCSPALPQGHRPTETAGTRQPCAVSTHVCPWGLHRGAQRTCMDLSHKLPSSRSKRLSSDQGQGNGHSRAQQPPVPRHLRALGSQALTVPAPGGAGALGCSQGFIAAAQATLPGAQRGAETPGPSQGCSPQAGPRGPPARRVPPGQLLRACGRPRPPPAKGWGAPTWRRPPTRWLRGTQARAQASPAGLSQWGVDHGHSRWPQRPVRPGWAGSCKGSGCPWGPGGS